MLSRLPGLILPGLSLAALLVVGVLALRGDRSDRRPQLIPDHQEQTMPKTTDPQRSFRAVFTVTIETRKGGDYYYDHDDLVRNVTPWIEDALEDRDDIRDVTVVEAEADEPAVPSAPADRAAIEAAAFKAAANYVRGHSADERYGRASISTALCAVSDELNRWADEASSPGRMADEAQAFVCKCPAELCRCGHHAAVSQPGKEA